MRISDFKYSGYSKESPPLLKQSLFVAMQFEMNTGTIGVLSSYIYGTLCKIQVIDISATCQKKTLKNRIKVFKNQLLVSVLY